jgi:hypothetical protein
VTAPVPESECKSEMSGMLSGGETNTVDAEPEAQVCRIVDPPRLGSFDGGQFCAVHPLHDVDG